MLRHIVLQRWKAEVSDADRVETIRALRELVATMPGVVAIVADHGLMLAPNTYDAALVVDFVDEASWRAYQDDPRHKAFVAAELGPRLAERAGIQLALPAQA